LPRKNNRQQPRAESAPASHTAQSARLADAAGSLAGGQGARKPDHAKEKPGDKVYTGRLVTVYPILFSNFAIIAHYRTSKERSRGCAMLSRTLTPV